MKSFSAARARRLSTSEVADASRHALCSVVLFHLIAIDTSQSLMRMLSYVL